MSVHEPVSTSGSATNQSLDLETIIEKVFHRRLTTEIPAVEFKKLFLEISGTNESKVKRMIAEAVEFGYVRVSGDRRNAVYHLEKSH